MTKKQIILNNFLGGIAWGLGSAIGAIILFAILVYFLSKVNFIPIIGNFVSQINSVVEEQNNK